MPDQASPPPQIGIVLVTHGDLAQCLINAWEHVVGPQTAVVPICIDPDDDMEQRRKEIRAAITSTDTGKGVIVLTDMFGGTPSNLAISLMKPGTIEVIAGVNLPVLIKLAQIRDQTPLDEAADLAQEAGRRYLTVASSLVNR